MIKYHSQPMTRQDEWVIAKTGGKRDGFFVEVGAHDGERHSNTLTLEQEFGWTGVLIEPNPILFEKLQRTRPNCRNLCKVVAADQSEQNFIFGEGMSSAFSGLADYMPPDWRTEHAKRCSKSKRVETFGLSQLLHEVRAPYSIDYLSIDVEGAEMEVLKGLLKNYLWKVDLITVEFRYDQLLLEKLEQFLSHLYRLDEIREFDACFVRNK